MPIQIYHLNKDTRSGHAIISDGENRNDKPRIRIIGSSPLERSAFTKSLSDDSVINVRAKRKIVNGTVKSITIKP